MLKELLAFLDKLSERGIKFALFNVLKSKNRVNEILKKWISNSQYTVYHLKKNYSNSNYHRTDCDDTDEILVVNY